MKYTIYDKELNEMQYGTFTDAEVKDFIRHIYKNETDRENFYEFTDENGKTFSCQDLLNKE